MRNRGFKTGMKIVLLFGVTVATLCATNILALDNSSEGVLSYHGKSAYSSKSRIIALREQRQARKKQDTGIQTLEERCPTINTKFKRLLWKSESSGHIPNGDSRTGGCTFIYGLGSNAPGAGRSCLAIYDGEGTQIGKLGRYALNNGKAYKERYYTGTGCAPKLNCSTLSRRARKNTGSSTVYVGTGGGTCQKIPTAIGRHGGV